MPVKQKLEKCKDCSEPLPKWEEELCQRCSKRRAEYWKMDKKYWGMGKPDKK